MRESEQLVSEPARARIGIVTTVDSSLHVLHPGLFARLQDAGYDVTGVCADGPFVERVRAGGLRVETVPMVRHFAPLADLRGLWRLVRLFRRERFDLIHYSTPKAALLASLAGRLAGRAKLLYTLRGLGYQGYRGAKREIGRQCERIACACADRILCISRSLAEEAAREGLAAVARFEVLGAGSSRGVDCRRFRRDEATQSAGHSLRRELGIPPEAVVLGYVGRIAREKGLERLARVFPQLAVEHAAAHMILIGHTDQRDPLDSDTLRVFDEHPRIHVLPFTDRLEDVYAAMDMLVLHSDREGFGNALIEGSAMELPVVGSDIPGCRDAVRAGETGLLVRPDDEAGLAAALRALLESPDLRQRLGQTGVTWVRANFDRERVWSNLIEVYEAMLRKRPE